jgi:uncharacterized protein
MLKIVLDTNVLLVSISQKSKLHIIFKSLVQGDYILCVSTDILAEYAEIVERHLGTQTSNSVLNVIENLPNVEFVTSYYRFNLLNDPDDNKFVDVAVAAGADYIVTNDSDFKVLSKVSFPKVNVISSDIFKTSLE